MCTYQGLPSSVRKKDTFFALCVRIKALKCPICVRIQDYMCTYQGQACTYQGHYAAICVRVKDYPLFIIPAY